MISTCPAVVCWLALNLCCVTVTLTAQTTTPPLRTALEVRSLSPEEAARQLTVELHGTVVFVEAPTSSDAIQSVLIQDGTAGTFFRGLQGAPLQAGDEVAVKGVTSPGMFLPGIENATYKKLGHREPPSGAPVAYADLLSGRYHYQLVAVEGIVQAVTADGDRARTTLLLAMGQELLEVSVYAAPREGLALVDSRVRIQALAAGTINHHRQLVKPVLWLQEWSGVNVLKPAPKLEAIPTISGSRLLAFNVAGQGEHRVRVQGTVLSSFSDGTVYIRDETTALSLQFFPPVSLSAGTWIEAVGFPWMQRFSASLTRATLVKQTPGAPLPETQAGIYDLMNGTRDNDLVMVTATLSGCFRTEEGHELVLQEDGLTIRAQVPHLDYEPPVGARVQVAGICQVKSNISTGIKSLPHTVELRCRDAGDVVVLNSPPWWTARRLAMAVGVLVLVVGMAALWITILRRQVRRQTTALRCRIEREAKLEERQRIAREFHDTLEQGLTGLLLRLEAVQARGVPEKSAQLLTASRGLVSQMQVETRSLVSDLRQSSQESVDLAAALRALVQDHPAGCGPALELDLPASLPPLPSRTVHHLRMVAREGLTNAIKHAQAGRVRLAVEVKGKQLRMSVADDGQGFPSAGPGSGQGGHFGCIGIEERCEKLGATAQWRSTPGKGTVMEIELSLDTPSTASHHHLAPTPLHS